MLKYVRPERVSIKLHPEISEKWIQDLIAENPSILGLGELALIRKERIQRRAGRLDLLLQDADKRRYEVEIQLGPTDESHLVRCIEYWDIERKTYPQYDHCAVIVAEDITSRFLNVISLFNGTIPLIAIQMQALNVGDSFTLVFTKVLDELKRGLVDQDEEDEATPTDRKYWEGQGSKETLQLTDELLSVVKQLNPALELKYNKFYIGLARNGRPDNFITFIARKKYVTVQPRMPRTDDVDSLISSSGIDALSYDRQWGRYRLNIDKETLKNQSPLIRQLFDLAFAESRSE